MNPDRIRHGIRAVEDDAVLDEIVRRGLVLDVCPTSNLRTGVVASVDAHPLPKLRIEFLNHLITNQLFGVRGLVTAFQIRRLSTVKAVTSPRTPKELS